MIARRALLGGVVAALVAPWIGGCGSSKDPEIPPQPPLPPLRTTPLSNLVASAGLRWMLLASPRDLLGVPWIPPLVDVAVSGARFDRFAQATGIDLRALPEAVVTSTAPPASRASAAVPAPDASEPSGAGEPSVTATPDDVLFYLVRHTGDAAVVERSFRARLTAAEKRSVDRPDLVRVSGKIGTAPHVTVLLGPDVAGFQDGGSASRGPARIAALYAEGKLQKASPALAAEPLRSLAARLGKAELLAFAPGPFEGDLARGLRGLLGAATAVGASLRPTFRQSFQVTIAVTGDFSTSAAPASQELRAAWNDLAAAPLGHLLGLDAPVTPAVVMPAPDVLLLTIELSGRLLAEGLAKATATKVEDIFR